MEKWTAVLQVVAPIFAAVCIGVLARKKDMLTSKEVRGMEQFVMKFGLPCLLFNSCLSAKVNAESLVSFAMVFLWASAGVGLALGVGFYEAAAVAGFSVFAILTLLQRWDDKMKGNTKIIELYIELSDAVPMGELIRNLRQLNLDIESIEMEKDTQLEDNAKPFIATLRTKKRGDHRVLIERIKKPNGVIHLEEL